MKYIIKNTKWINEGKITTGDILIDQSRIQKLAPSIDVQGDVEEIDGSDLMVFPGIIDDQVHFREPGLTHKANIYTESRAAAAGGITSFMEMPNTVPNTLTQELLEDKYNIAAESSISNYSFFMGASNDNLSEVLKTDASKVCGVKVFMGSSTGNMLVDKQATLEGIFGNCEMLIATHCEDEATIQKNTALFKEKYGEDILFKYHPEIRSEEACYLSSSMAVDLAKKNGTRLHILHISTEKELGLFDNSIPLENKKITSEACIHHMWFTDKDYDTKGSFIKWNPAVKKESDRNAIREAVKSGIIDVIATDHAPHTLEEKSNSYFSAPSGGPLVQHALPAMLDLYHQGVFSLEMIVEKMCHNPARLFRIEERGYIREGYFADLVLVKLNSPWEVNRENILSKCKWSPFEGHTFQSKVEKTFVSGHLAYDNGIFNESKLGRRLTFRV